MGKVIVTFSQTISLIANIFGEFWETIKGPDGTPGPRLVDRREQMLEDDPLSCSDSTLNLILQHGVSDTSSDTDSVFTLFI